MTTNEARQLFIDAGLSYSNINYFNLSILFELVKKEYQKYLKSGDQHAEQIHIRLQTILKKHLKFNDDGLEYAYLRVKGSYFDNRECISFNRNGFIGFCGELSTVNTNPTLLAFAKWVDILIKEKELLK